MTAEANKAFLREFADVVLNQKNLDALERMVAADFVEQVPFPGQGPGIEGLRYAIGAFISGFPDLRWILDEQIAEGEMVVSRFTMSGTHQGDFLGIPASGKPVAVWGVTIDRVRNGKLVESRIIMDTVTLLRQVGAMPSPETHS